MPDLSGPFSAACPTRLLLDQLAGKWSMLALIAVSGDPVRFNVLKRRIEGISQKVLGQTLRRLEMNGLVRREVFATVPVTVQYGITPLGSSLVPIVEAMRRWSIDHLDDVVAARSAYGGPP